MDPSSSAASGGSSSASGGSSSAGRRPAIDLNEIPPPPFPCDAPIPLIPTAIPIPLPLPLPPVPLFSAVPLPLLPPDPLALAIVCDAHANPTPAAGPPAVHPGEAGLTPLPCVLCGGPETRGGTVVCDGCERGFHVTCARFRPTQPHAALEDWLCCDCQASGRSTKRWTLGIARLLDINAPPPEAELEPDFALELPSSSNNPRMNNSHGGSSSRFAGQLLIANSDHVRTTLDTGKPTSEGRSDKRVILSRGFEDPVFASSIGRHSVPNAAVLSHPQGEMLMQSLREFAAERGVFLGEGWHVEYKQPTSRSGPYAFYCSPDGKKFESINDVAQYLGVSSTFTYSDKNERFGGYDTVHQSLPRRRRKKYPARISVKNNSPVKQDNQPSSCRGDRYSDSEAMKPQDFEGRSAAQVPKCSFDESGLPGSQDSNVGLPVQYEDFYVLSLGKVDLQTSYHNDSQIWPIGYQATWHDKITGSLFECEVSNGGESGPVFRVRRLSCSVLPIPNGATVLVHNKTYKADVTKSKERVSMHFVASCDSDEEIQMYLSDNKPPELDYLLCSSREYGETLAGSFVPMDIQKTCISTPDLNCHPEKSVESLKAISSLGDEIGEFYVEGRSSCLVWKMVSQTLIDACREMYKHSGCLYFHCEHDNGVYSPKSDGGYDEGVDPPCSLMKFRCASGPINTPRVIKDDSELEVSFKSLAKWIDQDRFGLDLGFVQEIIENLPGSRGCSRYQLLKDRNDSSTPFTVGSGSLLAVQKTEHGGERVAPYGLFHAPTRSSLKDFGSKLITRQPPQGRPLSSKLPAQLVGDVLQILELLWRFSEILGLKEPLSFEGIVQELIDPWPCLSEKETQNYKEPSLHGLENINGPEPLAGESDLAHREETIILVPVETASSRGATETKLAACTYARCHGVSLTKIHMCLLKVLIGELLCRVDAKETKPRRGRKKDVDNSLLMKESKTDILINELTWPELARRYILALSSMNDLDSPEVCSRKGVKVFRCLQGDGGVLCGSLSGVAGMEADAVMLAQAERQITDPLKQENEVLPMDLKDSDAPSICEPAAVSTGLPEWAEPLEPVRKLPTNVGTRIRKCVYESLNRSPPEWARKILEQSISKEVYKGNASGPTKKLVLSVLAEASGGPLQPRPAKRPKQIQQSRPISVSDAIMRKCRIVLRRAMFADEGKVFCNMLGTILDNTIDTEDASVICPPAMVSRPLDFRMIDLRLAHGAYAGCHEAFIEDVREVWHTIRMAYGEKPNLMLLVGTLSEKFESLYEEEVLIPFQKFVNHGSTELTDSDVQKEFHDFLLNSNEIPKAPWEDGVCKVCGIDKDDDSVLLCDTCDSEYHTYCLDPPLARIPEGNWYCPSCVASNYEKQDTGPHTKTIRTRTKRDLGVETQAFRDSLIQLAAKMEDGEYWEFSTEERIFLLKVLCDEVLNSVLIRDHLDQCIDKSNDLQQKLRAVSMEWKNLQVKADLLVSRATKESAGKYGENSGSLRELTGIMYANQGKLVVQRPTDQLNFGMSYESPIKIATWPTEDCQGNGQNDVRKNLERLFSYAAEKHGNSDNVPTHSSHGVLSTKNGECSASASDIRVSDKSLISDNLFPPVDSNKGTQLTGQVGQSLRVSLQDIGNKARQEVVHGVESKNHGLEIRCIPNMDDGSMLQNFSIFHGSYMPLDPRNTHLEQNIAVPMNSRINMSVGESLPHNQEVALDENQYNGPFSVTESGASVHEINLLKNEISHLEGSIATLQSEIMTTSFRRDFLGRDSFDRLFWVVGRPGKRPWLLVDGSISPPQEKTHTEEIRGHISNNLQNLTPGHHAPESKNFPVGSNADQSYSLPTESACSSSAWVFYESDSEIRELVNWLRESDPKERELKDNILLWQKLVCHQSNNSITDVSQLLTNFSTENLTASDCLATIASTILETKYGRFLELEVDEGSIRCGRKAKANCEVYRCECLEPVWPSRHHCLCCHNTFCTVLELQGHNDGKCTIANHISDESKVSDEALKGKGVRSESPREKENIDEANNVEVSRSGKLDISSKLANPPKKLCPYDIDEVCKKFITNNSNKKLVQSIGLIGSNGIPSLVPSPAYFLDPPVLLNLRNDVNINSDIGFPSIDEQMQLSAQDVSMGANTSQFDNANEIVGITKSPENSLGDDTEKHLLNGMRSTMESTVDEEKLPSTKKIHRADVCHNHNIPESSLRPLVGKVSQLLKRLKINMLDMEAALPEEALRPLKAHTMKRCAWRSYVKSSESIFEMVQATILLEGMIKTDYLKNGWWYWSSLSAAAKTPTVSSLAFRIYALDDCINYNKDPLTVSDPIESTKSPIKTGKKRKEMDA